MFHIKSIVVLLLLCALMVLAGCAGQGPVADNSAELLPAATIHATETPAVTPKPTPTPVPLPDIGTLVAQHNASGMVITWAPFVTEFACTLERRDSTVAAFSYETSEDSANAAFKTISAVDSESGTYTDAAPGPGGAQPVYRLCVSDGGHTVYSKEVQCEVPFDFGSTGGNLQNGGIACDKDGVVYRLGIQDDVIGIYALDAAGHMTLAVKGIASQINVAGGYLYFLNQATAQLYRLPLAGGEPELICEKKMVFVLATGSHIYGTLDRSNALVVMNADGSGMETLVPGGCYDLGAYGQTLYYTNTDSDQFCMLNLQTYENTSIPMTARTFAQLFDGRIYYQDEENSRRLISCGLDGSDVQVLLDQAVSGVNVTPRGVYCINRNDGDTLYRVALDGSDEQQLTSVSGDYVNTMGDDLLLINADGKFYQVSDEGTVIKLYG